MNSKQENEKVVRCNLCKTSVLTMYCDACHIHLCTACVGEHLSDDSKEHKVVPFKKRRSSPLCQKHSTKTCELFCEQCDSPICVFCISANEHEQHKKIDIMEWIESRKADIQDDLQELMESILPEYQEIVSHIPDEKDVLGENSHQLKDHIDRHGKDWHKEIDNIIEQLKSNIDEMHSTNIVALDQYEKDIVRIISEINQIIVDQKKMINSSDFCLVSKYKSKNNELGHLPSAPNMSIPSFTPNQIDKNDIYKKFGDFGFLSALPSSRQNDDDDVDDVDDDDCDGSDDDNDDNDDRLLIDKPYISAVVETEFSEDCNISKISCKSEEEIWTFGQTNTIRRYNCYLNTYVSEILKTTSHYPPQDMSLTQNGCLVYIDKTDLTIYIDKRTQLIEMIKLENWIPVSMCASLSGEFLVMMVDSNPYYGRTLIERYSGSTMIRYINVSDNFQSNNSYNYDEIKACICENMNSDICVADCNYRVIVVLNQDGELRFRYNGNPSITEKSFSPTGITTDSQCRILIADDIISYIHILDQDGEFLRFIDNCDLQLPCCVCVDTKDNLYVGERDTGKVKKIKYCM